MIDENTFVSYRPFNNVEECWKEMQKHQPFGWLTDGKKYVQVFRISSNAFNTCCIDISNDELLLENINFIDAFNYYKFTDGSKFGINLETYSLYVYFPTSRPLLVKVIKEVLCLDLKEAKNLVDDILKTTGYIKNLSKEVAHKLAVNINERGGRAYIKKE